MQVYKDIPRQYGYKAQDNEWDQLRSVQRSYMSDDRLVVYAVSTVSQRLSRFSKAFNSASNEERLSVNGVRRGSRALQ